MSAWAISSVRSLIDRFNKRSKHRHSLSANSTANRDYMCHPKMLLGRKGMGISDPTTGCPISKLSYALVLKEVIHL